MGLEISRKIVFQPSITRASGNWVYGYKVVIGNNPNRQFLFFHGNKGCAQDRLPLAGLYGDGIYYFHEYMGYGFHSEEELSKSNIMQNALNSIEHLDISIPTYFIGESIGSAVVSEIVAKRNVPNLKGIVLITPFCSLTEIANRIIPIFGGLMLKDKFNCIDNLKNYKGKVIIVGGTKDRITPFEHSKRLQEVTGGYLLSFNGDHNDTYKYGYQWINPLKNILYEEENELNSNN